ncbi:MAG: iron-sulfur cluster assembly scaffold protein [Gemmatimonadetes bacterium]|nr:iron-sulfur cluster assembly scaffold protein [Gemmatimonadota bacterium]
MDRETRIAWLVDHARRPRHRGKLPDADAQVPGGNPGCGDVITMYVQGQNGEDRLAAVGFEGEGCILSQAAASILAERVNRQRPTFEEVLAMSYEDMLDLLGRDVADARPRCATLALGTLKAAVKTVEMNRKLLLAGHTVADIQELRRAIAAQAEGTGLVLGEGAEQAAFADGSER